MGKSLPFGWWGMIDRIWHAEFNVCTASSCKQYLSQKDGGAIQNLDEHLNRKQDWFTTTSVKD